jgi:hypothetical protein
MRESAQHRGKRERERERESYERARTALRSIVCVVKSE